MQNSKSIKLKIPCGYKIVEKNKTLPFDNARKLLSTKKIGRYTSVTKQRDDILLSSHVIKCPYCDGETPAYSHYLYDFGKMHYSLQKELINNFLDSQIFSGLTIRRITRESFIAKNVGIFHPLQQKL